MKKLLFIISFTWAFVCANAQDVVSSNYGGKSVVAKQQDKTKVSSTDNSSDTRYRDFTLGISDGGNVIGLNTGVSTKDELGYGVVGVGVYTGATSGISLTLGYGLNYRSVGDSWMFVAYVYPYLGGSYLSTNDKSKVKFTYGAAGGAKIGYNVYTSAKGGRHFVTVGYGVNAYEFHTKNLFKNGSWQLGLTVEI